MYPIIARNVLLAVMSLISTAVFAQPIQAPLPLEVVAETKRIVGHVPNQLSPDGEWIALEYSSAPPKVDIVGYYGFSSTGVPQVDSSRRRIQLAHVPTGRSLELSQSQESTWGASWSPDGSRMAYCSDRGGKAGLWVWSAGTKQSQRIGDVIVRPYWSFEIPRWTGDSKKLIAKVIPAGMNVKSANSLLPQIENLKRPFQKMPDVTPSVIVMRAGKDVQRAKTTPRDSDFLRKFVGDLAVIDVESGAVDRIVDGQPIGDYRLSPDQKHIAYTVARGWLADGGKAVYDLRVRTLSTGQDRLLANDLPSGYGNEFNWSPDSRHIAFLTHFTYPNERRQVVVYAAGGGAIVFPSNLGGSGESANVPLWEEHGDAVYMVGGGKLWRLDLKTRGVAQVGNLNGVKVTALVAHPDSRLVWKDGGKIWALARDASTSESLLLSVDPVRGQSRIAFRGGDQTIEDIVAVDAARDVLVYTGSDPEHLGDLWLFDMRSSKRRQLTRLNHEVERHAHGETKLVSWVSGRGERLEGALMLPPGYKPGKKLPTIVWVYAGGGAGQSVSEMKRYGLGWSRSPVFNLHVLTSRGYAVFRPDVPFRTGEVMADVHAAVMPGIDALIAQGYTDPERLAVMGQSFGSYNTWALLVQTNRFKAAVTTGNVLHPHPLAGYVMMNPADGNDGMSGYEVGQMKLGNPWTYRDRYLKNSVLLRLNEVTTPLLMGQGSVDASAVGSDSMFVALRRLGKDVEYRMYENEGHVIQGRTNVIDFWKRRLEFFREHLGSEGIATDRPEVSLHRQ